MNYHQLEISHPSHQKTILITHGYAEHIERYRVLADRLYREGFNVYGFDFRGHGKSEGKRAHIISFDDLLEDLRYFYNNTPHQSLHLYGHSMGSLTLAYWLAKDQPSNIMKVILSSGLFKLDDSVAPLLRKIAPFISAILPSLPANKLDSSLISRVDEEVIKYDNDPLVYRGGTRARFGHEMIKAMQYVHDHAHLITQDNIMIIQGDSDQLTNMSGSEELYHLLPTNKKSLHIIEGGYHELLNDECRVEYLDIVAGYLVDRD